MESLCHSVVMVSVLYHHQRSIYATHDFSEYPKTGIYLYTYTLAAMKIFMLIDEWTKKEA